MFMGGRLGLVNAVQYKENLSYYELEKTFGACDSINSKFKHLDSNVSKVAGIVVMIIGAAIFSVSIALAFASSNPAFFAGMVGFPIGSLIGFILCNLPNSRRKKEMKITLVKREEFDAIKKELLEGIKSNGEEFQLGRSLARLRHSSSGYELSHNA